MKKTLLVLLTAILSSNITYADGVGNSTDNCAQNYKAIGEKITVVESPFMWMSLESTKPYFETKATQAFAAITSNIIMNTIGVFFTLPIRTAENLEFKKYYLGMSDYIQHADTKSARDAKKSLISYLKTTVDISDQDLEANLDKLVDEGFFCEARVEPKLSEKGSSIVNQYGGWFAFNTKIRQENPKIVNDFYNDLSNFESTYVNVLHPSKAKVLIQNELISHGYSLRRYYQK